LAGKLDGAVVNSIFGLKSLAKEGLMDKVDILPMAVAPVPLAIGLSHKKFNEDALREVNKHIKELLASPKWKEIVKESDILGFVKLYPLAAKD
jgi:ABC-type amino acid transport substrate-binding protein